MAAQRVLIVGGGASGAIVALHLLRRGKRGLEVEIVERAATLGRGVAYAVESPVFRLNVAAGKMSVDPRRPDDFVMWSSAPPGAFAARATFGAYVEARLHEAAEQSEAVLRVTRDDVVDVQGDGVLLASGVARPAEHVVLATGLAARVTPSPLPEDERIVDAWDEAALHRLPGAGRVLVLGAGLSALDVVALLDARGFRGHVTILSRRGLLPAPHLEGGRVAVPLDVSTLASAPTQLRPLVHWVRELLRVRVAAGEPWQLAMDALRPNVSQLYRSLAPHDRARFVRSVRPFWEVLRHRAPVDALGRLQALREAGHAEVLAGRVAGCAPEREGLEVSLALMGGRERSVRYDRIVRCIGPALDPSENQSPLVRALERSGRAGVDPAGLGIMTDEHGRVVDAAGEPSEHLLAIGAVRRASSWETTSIPDISRHALALAERILP